MDTDTKECIVVENDVVQVIVIKKTNCSMREAINRAVDRLLEEWNMLTVEELDFIWNFLQGRMSVNNESMKLADKIYHLKETAKSAGKKEIQVVI